MRFRDLRHSASAAGLGHPIGEMHRSTAVARWRAAALLASIVGAAASAYLLVEYVTGQPGVCLTGSGCDLVRASAYAYPLGIPTPLFGLVFYLLAAWLVLRSLEEAPMLGVRAPTALLALAIAGAAASLVLTALEAFVIHAFCSWCLVQAGASLALLAAGFALAVSRPDVPKAHSSRTRQQAARELEGERSGLRRIAKLGGGVAAIAVAALLAVGATGGSPSGTPDPSSLTPAGSPHLGNGAVQVVEFADFQCPGCASVAPVLAKLATSDAMTLVYRYFPLDSIHANADASARAAVAADRQSAFWQMSEALYAQQSAWEGLAATDADAYFLALAGQLGLDVDRWQVDYGSAAVAASVSTDLAAAQALGLSGTPTIFIAGQQYTGALNEDAIRAAVAAAS